MGKDRSFAAKVAKGAVEKPGKHCPKCGQLMDPVFLVASEKSSQGSWKFRENMVDVCKCNENEVFS